MRASGTPALTVRCALALAVSLALGACAGGDVTRRSAAGPEATASAGLSGTVDVFAAASLTEAFGTLGKAFEKAHPATRVRLNLGASSSLAQQIVAGAPADVFAAASPATMRTVTDAGQAGEPAVFARNRLAIAVPPDNPGRITGLADFADEDKTFALCAEQVPCGAAAKAVFAAAGVEPRPDTLEQDVKAALAKVRLGEVDAALVYRTDVRAAAGEVTGIAFPEADDAPNDYLLATLDDARDDVAARAFVALVLSEKGQSTLADAGFDRP